MTALWVVLGAAAGAPLRFLTDAGLVRLAGPRVPWGTLVVNVVGSLVLGLVVGAGVSSGWAAALGTGFCGALTTFSTFGLQTVSLLDGGERRLAVLNVAAQLVLGVAAATLGFALTR